MTNVGVLKNKISEIEEYFTIIKKYQNYSKEEIEKDLTLRGAVERYLFLLCQSSIDLGEALVSFANLRRPTTYGETFLILKENNILTEKITQKMVEMVGFRNILTHAYGEINSNIVYDVLKKDIEEIKKFVYEVKEKIGI